jgi:hypothetical protein
MNTNQQRALGKLIKGLRPVKTYVIQPEVQDREAWMDPKLGAFMRDLSRTFFWEYPNGCVQTYYNVEGVSGGWYYESLRHAAKDQQVDVSRLVLHWGETAGQLLSASGLDPWDYGPWGDKSETETLKKHEVLAACLVKQDKGTRALERLIQIRVRQHPSWQRAAIHELAELLVEHKPLPLLQAKAEALWALIPAAAAE